MQVPSHVEYERATSVEHALTLLGRPDHRVLAGRGVEVVLLGDEDCVAAMREFQRRYPDVWSEDIGGR